MLSNSTAIVPANDTRVVHIVVDSAALCVGVSSTSESRSSVKLLTSALLLNAVEDY